MQELNFSEVEAVSGAGLSANEAASLILAVGAIGGPATFCFAAPIAMSLYYLSE